MTVWKPIPLLPRYFASSDGQVRFFKSIKPVRPHRDKNGYLYVGANKDGKLCRFLLHRLIASAFLGPYPAGLQTRHLDGNSENCIPSNLVYGTAKDNANDRERHGRTCRGDTNGNTKLADRHIPVIRELYRQRKLNQYQLAREFGISQAQVNNIILGKQRQARLT